MLSRIATKEDLICGRAGYRSLCLSHAKGTLYHLSYTPSTISHAFSFTILPQPTRIDAAEAHPPTLINGEKTPIAGFRVTLAARPRGQSAQNRPSVRRTLRLKRSTLGRPLVRLPPMSPSRPTCRRSHLDRARSARSHETQPHRGSISRNRDPAVGMGTRQRHRPLATAPNPLRGLLDRAYVLLAHAPRGDKLRRTVSSLLARVPLARGGPGRCKCGRLRCGIQEKAPYRRVKKTDPSL